MEWSGQAMPATLRCRCDRLGCDGGRWVFTLILGNHDHWTDAGVVSKHLRTAGVRLLRNEAVRLVRAGQVLWLAGVDDVWERRANLPLTLADVPPGAPVVLFGAMSRTTLDEVADQKGGGVISCLQLSGHSHGGPSAYPRAWARRSCPYLAEKYPAGAYRVGDMWLYTNRGVRVPSRPAECD